MQKIEEYVQVIEKIKSLNEGGLIISLQNTVSSLSEKNHLYFLPLRQFKNYLFAGICNGNNQETRYFLERTQDLATHILVDVEKKYPWMECMQSEKIYMGNIELLVDDILDKEKAIFIWPNSMTVEACLAALSKQKISLSLIKVAIVGVGNIGFKLALRLVEAGAKVSISSKNYESTLNLSTAINQIKPKSTIAAPLPIRETHTCVSNQDIVFICSGSSIEIDRLFASSIKENTKVYSLSNLIIPNDILDILKSKHIQINIIDITPFYFLEITKKKFLEESAKPIKNKYRGFSLVSGGFKGEVDDIVVDNADNPLIVLGKIDKSGKFVRETILWEEFLLKKIE